MLIIPSANPVPVIVTEFCTGFADAESCLASTSAPWASHEPVVFCIHIQTYPLKSLVSMSGRPSSFQSLTQSLMPEYLVAITVFPLNAGLSLVPTFS